MGSVPPRDLGALQLTETFPLPQPPLLQASGVHGPEHRSGALWLQSCQAERGVAQCCGRSGATGMWAQVRLPGP